MLLLARNNRSARNLAHLLREREIQKTYLALVDTSASETLKTQVSGSVFDPLAITEEGRVQIHSRISRLGFKEAHTDWELLGKSVRILLQVSADLTVNVASISSCSPQTTASYWIETPDSNTHCHGP